MFSRRKILAVTAAGAAMSVATAQAASFGNPDLPPQGAINATAPGNLTDPGSQNPAIAAQFPSSQSPPATDIGGMPLPWATFNNAPKRIQKGGWARQVTQADFAVSTTISGVNMRLTAGGVREMHWHQAAEWAIMTYGTCRVTVLDNQGRPYIADVKTGDIWYFPSGAPHSLQGLGPDGCEFVICFDDGHANEFNTLLLSDWIAHTPPEILAKNFGVPAERFANIPLQNLWIFQGVVPADLATDRTAAYRDVAPAPFPFVYGLGSSTPVKSSKHGNIRIADTSNFKASATISAAFVTVKPGAMREMHWHPNADEWQYYINGHGRMTIFNSGPSATTMDFTSGDIGYVKRNFGHYIENTGDDDLVFVEVFRASRYEEVSLSNWLTHTPPSLVAQSLNVTTADIESWPADAPGVMPTS
jgi:oxalate decarboxylase